MEEMTKAEAMEQIDEYLKSRIKVNIQLAEQLCKAFSIPDRVLWRQAVIHGVGLFGMCEAIGYKYGQSPRLVDFVKKRVCSGISGSQAFRGWIKNCFWKGHRHQNAAFISLVFDCYMSQNPYTTLEHGFQHYASCIMPDEQFLYPQEFEFYCPIHQNLLSVKFNDLWQLEKLIVKSLKENLFTQTYLDWCKYIV